jgi:outer membrane protein assembly factor BamD (BamD/ComL family)
MKKTLSLFALAAIISLSACQSQRNKSLEAIKQLETELKANSNKPVSAELATKMIDAYLFFADNFPQDSLASEYLFKAGDVASGTHQSTRAVELFTKVYEKYPDSKRGPYALFLKGFVYETQLSDFFKARQAYETFVARYPAHPLANDVKFSLENLGKSDEELIKGFEDKLNAEKANTQVKK